MELHGRHSYFDNIRHSMNSHMIQMSQQQQQQQMNSKEMSHKQQQQQQQQQQSSSPTQPIPNGKIHHQSNNNGIVSTRKSNPWTSNLSKSINWFYNQSGIDAAAAKVYNLIC